MGYYSSVALTLLKSDVENASKKVKEALGDPVSEKDIYALYLWEDIKWYDSFPDVASIIKFMRDGRYYRFIRFGEDFTDYEDEGNYNPVTNRNIQYEYNPFNVYVNRSFTWD